MNSLQRVMTVLSGEIPDRVPVCLHNFLMATQEAGISIPSYRSDPQAMARSHLHAWEKYGHDCILVDPDTTLLAEAMGAKSECAPGEPGKVIEPAIQSLDEVDRLKVVNPWKDGRIPALLEAVNIMRKEVGQEVAIRGNADQGAFSLACLVRGMEDFLMDLVSEPDHPGIQQLLEVCYLSHLEVHRALKKAGAHFTSLGDSFGGPDVVSPNIFRRFVCPWEKRLVQELAKEESFVLIHICGNTTSILHDVLPYDFCGFELDYKTDIEQAKRIPGSKHVLFGNVDPSGILAMGSPEQVRKSARQLIQQWKPGGRFVLNAGCAIPASTPSENIHAFIETAHQEGKM